MIFNLPGLLIQEVLPAFKLWSPSYYTEWEIRNEREAEDGGVKIATVDRTGKVILAN